MNSSIQLSQSFDYTYIGWEAITTAPQDKPRILFPLCEILKLQYTLANLHIHPSIPVMLGPSNETFNPIGAHLS